MNYKASDIDGSWAVNALHESLSAFNAQSSRQTEQMLRLTKVIAALTMVMLVGLGVQIYLVFYPPATPGPASTNSAATKAVPGVAAPTANAGSSK